MLSVVVPIYNLESYLSFCLDSILSQTYQDYEVLLIDDGSTDHSADICRKYEAKDSRFRLIQKENGGVSSARNRGLDEAQGEYITFIDGDDICSPAMLELLMSQMKDENIVLSRCSYQKLYHYDKVWKKPNQSAVVYSTKDYVKKILDGSAEVGVWGGVYLRKKIGSLRFDLTIRHNEDKLFLFQYVLHCDGFIASSPEQLYGYYTRPNSATQSGYHPRLLSIIPANEIILEQTKKNRPDLLHEAELNLQVARLSILKSIIESGKYQSEQITYQEIKKVVLENVVKSASVKRRMELYSLKLGDGVYKFFIRLYRLVK